MISGGIFDVTDKESLLVDINSKLSDESTWSNLELSQTLNKEKAHLEKFLNSFHSVDDAINDNLGLLEIAIDESDEESIDEINKVTEDWKVYFKKEDNIDMPDNYTVNHLDIIFIANKNAEFVDFIKPNTSAEEVINKLVKVIPKIKG